MTQNATPDNIDTLDPELDIVVSSDNAELRGVVTSLIAQTLDDNGFSNIANLSREGIDSEVVTGDRLISAMDALREHGSSLLTAQIVLAQDVTSEDDRVGDLIWSTSLAGKAEPAGDDEDSTDD